MAMALSALAACAAGMCHPSRRGILAANQNTDILVGGKYIRTLTLSFSSPAFHNVSFFTLKASSTYRRATPDR